MKNINILLAGVGGQGVLLASQILTGVAMAAGLDVKQSEVHGMSQRGGSVTCHVRFGDKIYSPTVDDGTADFLLGFERLEALRNAHCIAPDGKILYNTMRINPSMVASGEVSYPEGIESAIQSYASDVFAVDGLGLAGRLGNVRTANTVMVGAISSFLPFSEKLWGEQLQKILPAKLVDLNLKAFELGKQAVVS
jgi:indolepyruvate ferredoxin oxidoreductase beta subunit